MIGRSATESGTFSTSFVRRMIAEADRFRAALLGGESPRIEDFLGEERGPERRELLRVLLEIEVGLLAESGEVPDRPAYRARFAEDADLVDAAWSETGLDLVAGGRALGSPSEDPTKELPALPDESTREAGPTTRQEPAPPVEVEVFPRWIGRYRLDKILGEGGFGRVYLGFDSELDRRVAIKLPHPRRVAQGENSEGYLAEARIVAGLDHAGIVPVYDFGRAEDGRCFIVSKYIPGGDLSRKLRRGRPSADEAARLLAAIADAVEHAHRNGLVHRDIKPRNLLLDPEGRPFLVDFGAALRDQDYGTGPTFAGTPFYMSPEQARGEGHLVDGRSDLFSLGVVLYEMITGTRPFRGANWRETIEQIKTMEPRPPRHVDGAIPWELERICLKALSKAVLDRYPTAAAMAEDLRLFLGRSDVREADRPAARPLIPKGLRSFEAGDSDSYLALLPGPRDRDGLPEALGALIGRIAGPEEDDPLRVGLVFGPSGSGKSSFVKAGLLPRLPRRVVPVMVEASPGETEVRLASNLRRRFPDLAPDADLAGLLASIRSGLGPPEGHQVLIVIDQFEQRLHARNEADLAGLTAALRQCDGKRVRCLLIVRDDFWMSVSRFLWALDIPLIGRKNGVAIDLFDEPHARRVLEEFGRAYGALPARPADLSDEESAFLDGATAGLAGSGGRVVPVQLSLFAEMIKGKPWSPATLETLGGAEGVGVAFLEETFAVETAPVEHRRHEPAARAVLEALLPGPGADLKGSTRSRSELLRASGYAAKPADFAALEAILDQDLRLITPVEEGDAGGEPCFQLTHDYLVPSLREWLARKQKETRRGRARQLLAERASLWNARHERKQLPSLSEWVKIRLLTRPSGWDAREAAMMRAADRSYAARSIGYLATASCVLILAFLSYCGLHARAMLDGLASAEPANVPAIVDRMGPYRWWVDPPLREAMARSAPGSRMDLRVRMAMLPVDPAQAAFLSERMLDAEAEDVRAILVMLARHAPTPPDRFWPILKDAEARRGRRLRAACAIASLAPSDPQWPSAAQDVVASLTAEDLFSLAHWSELLRPVREHLLPALKTTYLAHPADPQGDIAATLLPEFAADHVPLLCDLIQASEPRPLGLLAAKLKSQGEPAVSPLVAALTRIVEGEDGPVPAQATEGWLNGRARSRANVAMVLMALGRPAPSWALLEAGEDQRARTCFLLRLNRFGLDPMEVVRRLREEPEGTARQALVLALASYPVDMLPRSRRETLVGEFLAMYRDDPDPGVHAAVERLLGEWGFCDLIQAESRALARARTEPAGKRWYVDADGETMVIIPGPTEFAMGSPPGEPDRKEDEVLHRRRIDRSFAIGSKEVTVRQFLHFFPDHVVDRRSAPTDDCPVNRITWFAAACYCRMLDDREQLPEDQKCYPPVEQIRPGMVMFPDYLRRTGHRLPTEAEWEVAARARSTTSRFFGYEEGREILKLHAWFFYNSGDATHPVGQTIPNAFGLFDALGNAYERCHDVEAAYPVNGPGPVLDVATPGEVVDPVRRRVIRGSAFHRTNEPTRSAARFFDGVEDPNERVGFRVARTMP